MHDSIRLAAPTTAAATTTAAPATLICFCTPTTAVHPTWLINHHQATCNCRRLLGQITATNAAAATFGRRLVDPRHDLVEHIDAQRVRVDTKRNSWTVSWGSTQTTTIFWFWWTWWAICWRIMMTKRKNCWRRVQQAWWWIATAAVTARTFPIVSIAIMNTRQQILLLLSQPHHHRLYLRYLMNVATASSPVVLADANGMLRRWYNWMTSDNDDECWGESQSINYIRNKQQSLYIGGVVQWRMMRAPPLKRLRGCGKNEDAPTKYVDQDRLDKNRYRPNGVLLTRPVLIRVLLDANEWKKEEAKVKQRNVKHNNTSSMMAFDSASVVNVPTS